MYRNEVLVTAFKPYTKYLQSGYVFLNLLTKKAYVGQTTRGDERIIDHIKGLFTNSKTNINMLKEQVKAFEVLYFPLEEFEPIVDGIDVVSLETMLMFCFKRAGFDLYNGNESHTKEDYNRIELIRTNSRIEDKEIPWNTYPIIDVLIQNPDVRLKICEGIQFLIEKQLIGSQDVRSNKQNRCDVLQSIADRNTDARLKIWEDRLDILRRKSGYVLLPNTGNSMKQELLKEDMNTIGIAPISLKELMYDSDQKPKREVCNKMMYHKWGVYVNQGPLTILKTKEYDIKKSTLKLLYDENGKINDAIIVKRSKDDKLGICVWSSKRFKADEKRRYLSLNETEEYTGPRYLLLPFTDSNDAVSIESLLLGYEKYEDETINEYFNRLRDNVENSVKETYGITWNVNMNGRKILDEDTHKYMFLLTIYDEHNKRNLYFCSRIDKNSVEGNVGYFVDSFGNTYSNIDQIFEYEEIVQFTNKRIVFEECDKSIRWYDDNGVEQRKVIDGRMINAKIVVSDHSNRIEDLIDKEPVWVIKDRQININIRIYKKPNINYVAKDYAMKWHVPRKKERTEKHTFDYNEMFPVVMDSKEIASAFLISEFLYLDDVYDIKQLKELFSYVHFENDGTISKKELNQKRLPPSVIEPDWKKLQKNELIKRTKKENKVKVLVAKLEYPYIIDILKQEE